MFEINLKHFMIQKIVVLWAILPATFLRTSPFYLIKTVEYSYYGFLKNNKNCDNQVLFIYY